MLYWNNTALLNIYNNSIVVKLKSIRSHLKIINLYK
jgi:hypothetical protein